LSPSGWRVFEAKNLVTESSPPATIRRASSTLINLTADTSSALASGTAASRRAVHRRDEVVDLLLLAGQPGELGRVLQVAGQRDPDLGIAEEAVLAAEQVDRRAGAALERGADPRGGIGVTDAGRSAAARDEPARRRQQRIRESPLCIAAPSGRASVTRSIDSAPRPDQCARTPAIAAPTISTAARPIQTVSGRPEVATSNKVEASGVR
jgi:hypothetical protein